jgi:septum site-determining protein MinD
MGKVVGVVSLKGGVGKTSTVAALGSAISDFGRKVLLIDANFSAPNLGVHLNILDPETTLHNVFDRTANMKDAIYDVGGMHVIPSALFSNRIINPMKLRDKLKHIKKQYDMTILDSAPAINDESLGAMFASDEILVVTTPDYSTLSTTLKSVKIARQRGIPISGLILNKVHGKNFELSIHDIEETAGVPVMAVVPHDVNVMKAQSKFMPSTMHNPRSVGSEEYRKLAATLMGEKYKPFSFNELFRKLTPRRQEINREIYYDRVFRE